MYYCNWQAATKLGIENPNENNLVNNGPKFKYSKENLGLIQLSVANWRFGVGAQIVQKCES